MQCGLDVSAAAQDRKKEAKLGTNNGQVRSDYGASASKTVKKYCSTKEITYLKGHDHKINC